VRRSAVLATVVATAALVLPGCSQEPREAPLPDGVGAVLDQGRMQRQDREVFVRLSNPLRRDIHVTSLTLSSTRSPSVTWSGEETVEAGYEADVVVRLPAGRCGTPTRYRVELVYRVGDGTPVRSRVAVTDRYGAVTRVLDADCARRTLEDAAGLEVGRPAREGRYLRVPVVLTPTGDAGPVRVVGYGATPLVRPAPGSAQDVDVTGTAPLRADLVLEPARCDPHAIAEDKVGRLVPLEVAGPGLPDGTAFTLPLDRSQRTAVLDYVRSACGLS
jgi:hypothetical protein